MFSLASLTGIEKYSLQNIYPSPSFLACEAQNSKIKFWSLINKIAKKVISISLSLLLVLGELKTVFIVC